MSIRPHINNSPPWHYHVEKINEQFYQIQRYFLLLQLHIYTERSQTKNGLYYQRYKLAKLLTFHSQLQLIANGFTFCINCAA